MPRSFEIGTSVSRLREPQIAVRAVLGLLLTLNLVALFLVLLPPGGSTEELEGQLAALRRQFVQKRVALERAKVLAAKVEKGRSEGDQFQTRYFTDRRLASSTFIGELSKAAQSSGIKPREHSFVFEPVEGSDTLSMMTIVANYEGTYTDLVQFVNRMDRSGRFLILDTLTATPQTSGGLLTVNLRLNAFVREMTPAVGARL